MGDEMNRMGWQNGGDGKWLRIKEIGGKKEKKKKEDKGGGGKEAERAEGAIGSIGSWGGIEAHREG